MEEPQIDHSQGPPHRSRVVEGSPVYYGWLILLAATFGMMMTSPGQTFGVSVFLDDIIAELGLSRSTVSLLYTIGTLVGSMSLPFVGRFIDRKGPRVAVVVITALFALACVAMGFVTGLFSLLLGFILIRGLGQGSLGLVSLHVINIWFVRRRGLAIGLSGIGIALATGFFPLLFQVMLDQFGWRLTYMILGTLVAAVMIPVGAIFYRSHPESYGLLPDGSPSKRTEEVTEVNYTAAGARRTLTFWLFVLGDFMVAALGTGLIFHHYSIMAAGGIDRLTASTFFVPLGALSAGAILLTGYLIDRMPPRFLLSLALWLLVAGIFLAGRATSPELVLVYGAVLGLSNGMKGAIGGSVYAYYFGRKHLGAIKGSAITITVAGTAVGPLLYAVGYEAAGSYLPVLLLSALAPLAVALFAPFLRPKRPDGTVL
ncbi:MAG: MFS transporter [Trueperaceae bacterium]